MAIEKTQEQTSGVSGNYWRVARVIVEAGDGGCLCHLELYKDSTARSEGKAPILVKKIWLEDGCNIVDFVNAGDTPAKLVYDKLKTLAEFSGASDV